MNLSRNLSVYLVVRRSGAVMVLALALLLPLLVDAPAEAAKVRRGIVSDIFEVAQSDRFIIKGRFKQPYRRGLIIVQSRFDQGPWSSYSRVRTTAGSKYRIPVAPRGATGDVVCYRLVVPGDEDHRRATVSKASRGQHAGRRFCIETTFG